MLIDADGFYVNGRFYIREFGYALLTSGESGVFHYDTGLDYYSLSEKDKNTATYVSRNIHGLQLNPSAGEHIEEFENYKDIISELYDKCRTTYAYLVGYKGGYIEKKILAELHIESINLETFGCPRYCDIHESYSVNPPCGFHTFFDNFYAKKRVLHCAKRECEVFREWMLQKMSQEPRKASPLPLTHCH